MSEVLYEQYKDALRRGHVAALRGRLDAAAAAYREAARIAPDRALPYVGLGGVLARLGRTDEALAAYAAALDRAPTDEGAMHGRADVLAAVGPPRGGRRHARPAGRQSSSATAGSPTPATWRAGRSSWPSRAAGAGRSRTSSPACGRQRRATPRRPRRSSARWASSIGAGPRRPCRPPADGGDDRRTRRAAAAEPARRRPIRPC